MLCAYDDASEQILVGAPGYISITASPLYPLQCFHVAFYHIDLHSRGIINTDIRESQNCSSQVRSCYKIRTECLSVKRDKAFLIISPCG